jgi:hypothetical protein
MVATRTEIHVSGFTIARENAADALEKEMQDSQE